MKRKVYSKTDLINNCVGDNDFVRITKEKDQTE